MSANRIDRNRTAAVSTGAFPPQRNHVSRSVSPFTGSSP